TTSTRLRKPEPQQPSTARPPAGRVHTIDEVCTMTAKVVVTGIGAVTPLGANADATWQAILAGTSGVHTMDNDWSEKYGLAVDFAAEVDPQVVPDNLKRVQAKRLDPSSQFALISAREAIADAGLDDTDPERTAVSWATGSGGVGTLRDAWGALQEEGRRRLLPPPVPTRLPAGAAPAIGMEVRARAGVRPLVSAGASSAESLGDAYDVLASGKADVIIAGGS